MTLHAYGLDEGERRKDAALTLLAAHREALIRRGQRALLAAMLGGDGTATADDVRAVVDLPAGIDAKLFGAVPTGLARLRIIAAAGYEKTCRAVAHARPLTRWRLRDRAAAAGWLATHPELPEPPTDDNPPAAQGLLFPTFPKNDAGDAVAAATPARTE